MAYRRKRHAIVSCVSEEALRFTILSADGYPQKRRLGGSCSTKADEKWGESAETERMTSRNGARRCGYIERPTGRVGLHRIRKR